MTISVELRKSVANLELFTDLVKSQVDKPEIDFERLLDGYLEVRRALAKEFGAVAQDHLLRGDSLLANTRKLIETRMVKRFANRIPAKYLVVRGYKSVHPVLLEYLVQHSGNPVRSSKLRVLTADQIHTERRVRELRDLGFQVEWKKVSDEDQYILLEVKADLNAAVSLLVRKNIKGDKKLSRHEKQRLMSTLENES